MIYIAEYIIIIHNYTLHKELNKNFQKLDGSLGGAEAVAQRCSVKKMFLEISQNSQENTCARPSFLIKLQA